MAKTLAGCACGRHVLSLFTSQDRDRQEGVVGIFALAWKVLCFCMVRAACLAGRHALPPRQGLACRGILLPTTTILTFLLPPHIPPFLFVLPSIPVFHKTAWLSTTYYYAPTSYSNFSSILSSLPCPIPTSYHSPSISPALIDHRRSVLSLSSTWPATCLPPAHSFSPLSSHPFSI